MTKNPDYYAILQVHPEADVEVIKAAYRKLAAKYHPDVSTSPEAVEQMKLLNEACEVLTDSDKRAAYDSGRGTLFTPNFSKGLGISWNRLYIILGLIIFASIATRLGIRVALVLAAGALVIWLVGKVGK